ncbi:MAG: hypothetical protein ACJATI_004501 [Halioglobus sp.]|jgi:hypothetical protein
MKFLYPLILLISVVSITAEGAAPDQDYSTNTTITTDETFNNVTIDDGVTVTISSTGSITCNNIDFQGLAGSLIIESGGNLTMTGDVLDNASASVTIEHGGSFIPRTGTTTFATGNILIEKSASSSGYSYVSSPISGATYGGAEYTYEEHIIDADNYGTWTPVTGGGTVPVGIGYTTYQSGDISFIGTPNVAQVVLPLTQTSSSARAPNAGHHLIGNPYTAAIDMFDFFVFGLNTAFTFGSYYVWNPSNNGGAGGYDTFTAPSDNTEYISSGQAFFIQLDYTSQADGIYNVLLDPSMLVTENNTSFFRTSNTKFSEIVLNFSSANDENNKLTFRFEDNFTSDFDKRYEAYSSPFEETGQLRVKAIHDKSAYDIIALPLSNYSIPISVKTSESLQVQAEVIQMNNIPDGYKLELINTNTNESFELSSGSKSTFDLSQLDNQEVFRLAVSPPILGLENNIFPFNVHINNRQLILKTNGEDMKASQVWLYSLDGRVNSVWDNLPLRLSEYSLPLTKLRNGLYIVKVKTRLGTYSKKIILN